MKNLELIQAFGDNPQVSGSSSYFRAFNGILFNRVPKSCSPVIGRYSEAWYPIFICDGIGLQTRYDTLRLPSRGEHQIYKAIENVGLRMLQQGKTVVRIDTGAEVPFGLLQPLKLRSVPNRETFIADILEYYLAYTFPSNYSTFPLTSKISAEEAKAECAAIAWEYAITTFAHQYAQYKKTLEASLNQLSSDESMAEFERHLPLLREFVNNDDLATAITSYEAIQNSLSKISEVLCGVSKTIKSTALSCGEICLSAPLGLTEKVRDKSRFLPNGYRPDPVLTIMNTNILKGWGDFAGFLTKLGFHIPKPFGFNLNAENISTLAAFRDTSAESMVNICAHLTRIVKEREAKEAEAEAKPEPCNLYLG